MFKLPGVALFGAVALTASVARADAFSETKLPERREIVLVRKTPPQPLGADAVILAGEGRPLTIVLPGEPTLLHEIASRDLKTYLELAVGAKVVVQSEADVAGEKLSGTVICLGPMKAKRLEAPNSPPLPPEAFAITARPGVPNPQADTIWITGGSDRGVFFGVVELLRRALGARWFPPRIYPGLEETACLETQLVSSGTVSWPAGTVRGGPKLGDRGVYFRGEQLIEPAIDWLLRNRVNIMMLSLGTEFPLPPQEQARCRRMIAYAKDRGIEVMMICISQNVSADSKKAHPEIVASGAIDPTLDVTRTESVKLFVDLVNRYDLDGFAWHSATEGIRIAKTPQLAAKPRYVWEAEYHQAYREAIRRVKPGARFVMLMGWVYMNPAPTMAEHFPKDTIAWVVPNTPIIDAANTDLDAYSKHFHCWYWLYVNVSKDGTFPVVKTDYLEKYCREAVKRGHGLMPQSAFYANTFNLQYVADAAWAGPAESTAYMDRYCADYFAGIPAAKEALDAYTQVTTRWRNWTNNLQTRPVAIRPEDFRQLKLAYETFAEAYQAAPAPLVADRVRDFAITALRAFRRYPGLDPRAYVALCTEAEKLLGKRPLDPETDFFGGVLETEKAEAVKAAASLKRLPGIRPKWEFRPPGHGYLCGHVLVADADGDGKNEVYCGSYTPRAYCLRGEDGSVVWSYEVETGTVGCDCTTLADVDVDGKRELIFGTEPKPALYVLRTAADAEPRLAWRRPLVGAFVAGGVAAFRDTDGTGKILVGTRWASPEAQGHLYFFNARDGTEYREPVGEQDVCSCTPAIGDTNGDGHLEFVYGNHRLRGIQLGGKVICRRVDDGEILWTYDLGDNTGSSTPTLCDLDADGKLDVIATCCHCADSVRPPRWTTVALRGTDGGLIWEYPFRAGAGIAIGKIEGKTHVYGVSTRDDDPYVACVRGADGKQSWRMKIDARGGAQPLVADANGDGNSEIFYGDSANRLVIRDATDGGLLHIEWLGDPSAPRHRDIGIGAVTLADADNDGSWEILLPSGDGCYRCLDTDWKVPAGADAEHPTKSRNLLRTGCFP